MLGPTFGNELRAAGLAGLPIVWNADGEIRGRELLTAAQDELLSSVIANHDPSREPAGDLRREDMQADAAVADLMTRLANASSAQIDAWFAANVTSAASAIAVLKSVVKFLAFRL